MSVELFGDIFNEICFEVCIEEYQNSLSKKKKKVQYKDIFDTDFQMVEEERVQCDHCERSVASSRYAPHLEKCMLKKATRQIRSYKQLYETVYEKKIDEEEEDEMIQDEIKEEKVKVGSIDDISEINDLLPSRVNGNHFSKGDYSISKFEDLRKIQISFEKSDKVEDVNDIVKKDEIDSDDDNEIFNLEKKENDLLDNFSSSFDSLHSSMNASFNSTYDYIPFGDY
eukprot:gene5173-8779_t